MNSINSKTKSLIYQTLENYNSISSNNSRVYIRPSGTEPLMRILVEAQNQKEVDSISNKIANKLTSEINKIVK